MDRKSFGSTERRFRLLRSQHSQRPNCARIPLAEHAGSATMYRIPGLFAALAVLCGLVLPPALAEGKGRTVFAAASMKNALDELNTAYAANTGVKIVASYAASSTLAKQIEQGAPADIFVSADTDWMDYAIARKDIDESTRINLLGNSLVLIAPKDSAIDNVAIGRGFDLAKLAGDGRIAAGDVNARSEERRV